MIVELAGSPGAGKTTLARSLADRLRAGGIDVDLYLSYRPDEREPEAAHRSMAAARRLLRAARELLVSRSTPKDGTAERTIAAWLLNKLPPRSLLWSIRLNQYLVRLLHTRERALLAGNVAVFDQGFVQAVCSLVVLGRNADDTRLAQALDAIPKPDLLIRVQVSEQTVAARLTGRERGQGRIERLFELQPHDNMAFAPAIDSVCKMLERQGVPIAVADCTDAASLRRALDTIEARIGARDVPSG